MRNSSTTALRWRARMTKEAIESADLLDDTPTTDPIEGSTHHHDIGAQRDEDGTAHRSPSIATKLLDPRRWWPAALPSATRCVDASLAACALCALWSLSVVAPRTWFTAVTATVHVTVCVTVWWQQQRQWPHGGIGNSVAVVQAQQRRQSELRAASRRLWQHHERLHQRLLLLATAVPPDEAAAVERRRECEAALRHLASTRGGGGGGTITTTTTTTPIHLVAALVVQLTGEFAATLKRLRAALQRQVTLDILTAALVSSTHKNSGTIADQGPWTAAGPDDLGERLERQLQPLAPAVRVDPAALRDALEPAAAEPAASSPHSALLRVLRQVQTNNGPTTTFKTTATMTRRSIFTIEPLLLLRLSPASHDRDTADLLLLDLQ